VTAAAVLAMHGLPALRFLTTDDPEERLILMALAKRAAQLRELEQKNLAVHVVNALGKAMRRGG
jgi:hypothetical protein